MTFCKNISRCFVIKSWSRVLLFDGLDVFFMYAYGFDVRYLMVLGLNKYPLLLFLAILFVYLYIYDEYLRNRSCFTRSEV